MSAPIFIGDEVSAASYRLAGVRVRVPLPGEELSWIEWACTQAQLVLVTAECASRIPSRVLQRLLAMPLPLVLIVPDVQERVVVPDLAARIRRQLGMRA